MDDIDESANRSYYACFQVAIATLIRAGIRPEKRPDRWSHPFVISQFVGQLIHQRRQFPLEIRRELADIQVVRHTADYEPVLISQFEAYRTLRRSRMFIASVQEAGARTE